MTKFGDVLSVNVGRAAPLVAQGETIISGFVKAATTAAQPVGPDGLTTDDHVDDAGDPDRAVLVYQRQHYVSWSRELGRELTAGMFGEQLTIDGPLEDDILIGDRLQVGDVVLQVTQPRIPCRKMAVRLEQEDMPLQYMRTGRTGFFCKVLTPGLVQAGARVELLKRGAEGLSVAELAQVLHRDEPDPDQLERVLAVDALPALVRTKLTKLRARLDEQATGWAGDRELLVAARTRESSEVVSFDLVDADGAPLPPFAAGQFLTVALQVPGAGRPVVRTYTLVGRTPDGGYRVGIKREPAPPGVEVAHGVASSHLHDQVHAGSRVLARAPRGRFVLAPETRPVVLISAGIGITPMLAMLTELLADDTDAREVFFLHGARSSRQAAFRTHVREVIAGSARAHATVVYSRPLDTDRVGVDFDALGRLTADRVLDVLPAQDADFYVCGPVDFMADMVTGLLGAGVPEDQVHYEFFGAARSLLGPTTGSETDCESTVLDADGRPIVVTFARSGVAVPWRDTAFSLLALAESAGLRPEASCRTGLCNTCVARIDDGEIDYVIEPLEPVTPGKVAVCCARPRTSVMIDL